MLQAQQSTSYSPFSRRAPGTRPVTGRHDAHFLSRLDRLSTTDVDLALGLYRDHDLVKSLLNDANVSHSVDRVAISLRDPVRGPFVVVARDGHFVTCLGEGMRVGETPVLTREHFARVARRLQRYRDIASEIALHPEQELRRVTSRLLLCGVDVSREDFQAVAAWQPLIASAILEIFLRTAADLQYTYSRLILRQDKFKSRDEFDLRCYWQQSWSMAHLTLLLGVDGGQYLRSLFDVPELAPVVHRVCCQMFRTNVISHGLRGAWLAGKVGKPLLGPVKKIYHEPENYLQLLDAGISLSAVGHAHKKLQQEVGKVLAKSHRIQEGPNIELYRFMYRCLSGHYDVAMIEPKACSRIWDASADQVMEQVLRQVKHSFSDAVLRSEKFRAWARQGGRLKLLQLPHAIIDEKFETLSGVLLWLPSVVRMKAEDFYFPRKHLGQRRACSVSMEAAIALIEPRRQLARGFRPAVPVTVRAVPRPGRNERCPCRSGKKYKYCCLNQPRLAEVAEPRTDHQHA